MQCAQPVIRSSYSGRRELAFGSGQRHKHAKNFGGREVFSGYQAG